MKVPSSSQHGAPIRGLPKPTTSIVDFCKADLPVLRHMLLEHLFTSWFRLWNHAVRVVRASTVDNGVLMRQQLQQGQSSPNAKRHKPDQRHPITFALATQAAESEQALSGHDLFDALRARCDKIFGMSNARRRYKQLSQIEQASEVRQFNWFFPGLHLLLL